MKKILLLIITIVGFTTLITKEVAAFGFGGGHYGWKPEYREEILEKKAECLDLTVEDLEDAWKNRTLRDVLEGKTPEEMWNCIKNTVITNWQLMGFNEDHITRRIEHKDARMHKMGEWSEKHSDKPFPSKGFGHWK